ncbi:MAG: hypothetical protein RLY86_3726, partial [Pseudomonadota bacterium]
MSPSLPSRRTFLTGALSAGAAVLAAPFGGRAATGGTGQAGGGPTADLALPRGLASPTDG